DSATGALAGLDQLNPEQIQQLKTTAALFPDALVDSELGEVPEGWEVKTLDDVTSIIIDHRGKTPKKLGGDWVEEGHSAVSAKNIKGGRITRHDTIRFLDDEIYSKWMKVEIEKGDILLTSEAPMGEMYFITDETKYCLSQRLYALRADNENVTPSFLYLWLQTSIAQADLEGRATGTTVVGIRQVELRKVNSLVPSIEILKNFEKSILPVFEKLNAGELESQRLICLRDELLPKLLSGELSVGSAA
ncbi:MAG: restriction endonuclease subunit S, partial [Bermanella sp.]